MFSPNWIARLEYLHYELESVERLASGSGSIQQVAIRMSSSPRSREKRYPLLEAANLDEKPAYTLAAHIRGDQAAGIFAPV
jgi:hypothetical protein